MIRLAIPPLADVDLELAREVLVTGNLVQGRVVEQFEAKLAQTVESPLAVVVSSGTAALHLAMKALGVGAGDAVLTTAYSWPATANAIELCGATPVFIDIEPDTYNIDPSLIGDAAERARNEGLDVKAILPVHSFGQMADMTGISAAIEGQGIHLVEDAACALGAAWNGRPAGIWGDLACFSFHPRKTITTGEGGAVTTGSESLANRIRELRNHGVSPTSNPPQFVTAGYNYRMTEFQAALGLSQLGRLQRIIDGRVDRVNYYLEMIKDTEIVHQVVSPVSKATYQSFVVRLPLQTAEERDAVIHGLRSNRIEATLGTWHIPLTAFYSQRYGYQPNDFPKTDEVFRTSVTLPLHLELTASDQERIVETVAELVRSLRGAKSRPA